MVLDDIDTRILRSLMMDGRRSARQLSIHLGLSTVTVLARMKRMEKEGIIHGYTVIIDHEKLGYALTAIIEIRAKKSVLTDIEEEISRFENVCGVYDITGSTDAMIVAKFRTRSELNLFVKKLGAIQHVEDTITHIVLNTSKEDFRLT